MRFIVMALQEHNRVLHCVQKDRKEAFQLQLAATALLLNICNCLWSRERYGNWN